MGSKGDSNPKSDSKDDQGCTHKLHVLRTGYSANPLAYLLWRIAFGRRAIGLPTTVAQRYNLGMIRNNIRELLDRDPFVPFRLVLSSGRHYDVLDPQMTVLLKSEIFIAFPDGERSSLIPLLHVTSVETLVNGRRRRGGKT